MNIIKHNLIWDGSQTKRSVTKRIILHCSATVEGKDYTVEDVHGWHLANKWIGCGYNIIIYRDGSIHEGRGIENSGAHTSGYNSTSLGICYIGGIDANKNAKDTRTDEQKASLFQVVDELLVKYHLTINDVYGHRDLTSPKPNMKACPSFDTNTFKKEYAEWKSQNKCPFCGK